MPFVPARQESSGGYFEPDQDQPQSPLQSFARGAVNNFPLAPQAVAGIRALVKPGATYSGSLQEFKDQVKSAKEQNPGAYDAGAVGGALAPLAIPGVGEALEASPMMGNAALGAANAISDTDLSKNPGTAAIKGTMGAGIGMGSYALLGKITPYLAEKFGAMATNPEAASIAMKNPEMLKNIPTTEDLAQRLPDVVQKIKDQIGEHMDVAKDSLSTSRYLNDGAITKDEITNLIQKARGELGGIYTSEGQKAAGALENLGGDLKKVHETVSQKNVYDIMQKLDNEIPWDKIHSRPDDVTAEEWAMVNVRRGMRNLLGEKNPEFGAMMEPVSILEKDKGDLMSKFGLQRDIEGIRPGDQTVSRLATSLKQTGKAAKPESQRILENINSSVGEDIKTPLKLQAFNGPTVDDPVGIPSRIGGAVVGAGMGQGLGLSGMGLGAVAGQRVLRQPMSTLGRNAASEVIQHVPQIERGATQALSSSIIDNTIRDNPQALGKFGPMLQQAAQQGKASLGATHFVLQQRDPEYQELMKNLTQNGGGEQ